MNSMNDQRFFDLAMKASARQSTEAERAELESLLSAKPELKAELERLQTDAKLAREVAPITAAMESSSPEFPAYARERLQITVRQTLGNPDTAKRSGWNWRWALGLATATAAIVFTITLLNPRPPVIQVAMLDTVGGVRGAETNQLELLRQKWKDARVFSNAQESAAWERQPPAKGDFAKIIYDPAAAEVRVSGRAGGKKFTTLIPVEKNLAGALDEAAHFARDQFGQ